jgi:hypothetical protein
VPHGRLDGDAAGAGIGFKGAHELISLRGRIRREAQHDVLADTHDARGGWLGDLADGQYSGELLDAALKGRGLSQGLRDRLALTNLAAVGAGLAHGVRDLPAPDRLELLELDGQARISLAGDEFGLVGNGRHGDSLADDGRRRA